LIVGSWKPAEELIGDKAYDSDGLDKALRQRGIEMIDPNRGNRLEDSRRSCFASIEAALEERATVCLAV
jgi:hypothetical protein